MKENKPFQSLRFYIDIKENVSAGYTMRNLERMIENLGGKVMKTLVNTVTHVVFWEGKETTLEKAKFRNLICVSPKWVQSCHSNNSKVDDKKFLIDIHSTSTEELFREKNLEIEKIDNLEESLENLSFIRKQISIIDDLENVRNSQMQETSDKDRLDPDISVSTSLKNDKNTCKENSTVEMIDELPEDQKKLKMENLNENVYRKQTHSSSPEWRLFETRVSPIGDSEDEGTKQKAYHQEKTKHDSLLATEIIDEDEDFPDKELLERIETRSLSNSNCSFTSSKARFWTEDSDHSNPFEFSVNHEEMCEIQHKNPRRKELITGRIKKKLYEKGNDLENEYLDQQQDKKGDSELGTNLSTTKESTKRKKSSSIEGDQKKRKSELDANTSIACDSPEFSMSSTLSSKQSSTSTSRTRSSGLAMVLSGCNIEERDLIQSIVKQINEILRKQWKKRQTSYERNDDNGKDVCQESKFIRIYHNISPKTTHIVVGEEQRRTLKVLAGIAMGMLYE